jgi:hypothetical protein
MFSRKLFSSAVAMLVLLCSVAACAASQSQAGSVLVYPCLLAEIPSDAPLHRVTGRVIDDVTGAPVPGATVRLDSLCGTVGTGGWRGEDRLHQQAVTDRHGAFAFREIAPMTINLVASKGDDYLQPKASASGPIEPGSYLIGSETGPLTLRIAPAAWISGIVRDKKGVPMPDASVTLECYRTWAGWRRLEYCNTVETAADGSYRFGPLQPGRYYLVAEPKLHTDGPPARDENGNAIGFVPVRFPAQGMNDADSFLQLAEGQRAQVDFQFHREILHHITGSVAGGGKWAPLVDVVDSSDSKSYLVKTPSLCCEFEAWVPSGSFRLASQFTSPDGEFIGSMALQVGDTDLAGLVFPLAHAARIEIPIEISSVASRKAAGWVCLDSDLACGFGLLQLIDLRPNGYVEAGPQSTMSGDTRITPPYRKEIVSVLPGTYAIALAATGNVYAQSITSGATDLIREPLLVIPDDAPNPIRIILAEGVIAEGMTLRGEKPVRAWVYAIPEQPDARLFQPVLSGPDGKFRIQGLAPVKYLFFATDAELELDVHDPDVLAYWRQHGQAKALKEGTTTPLELQLRVLKDRN